MSRWSTINSWGGHCSPQYSFNATKYIDGLCTKWQYVFFVSWYNHGRDSKMSKKFKSFDRAYHWLVHKSPDFQLFRLHCGDGTYVWETDGSGTHEFDEYMRYVPIIENNKRRFIDDPGLKTRIVSHLESPDIRKLVGELNSKSVLGIAPCGKTFTFKSQKECAQFFGLSQSYMSQIISGVRNLQNGWVLYRKDGL